MVASQAELSVVGTSYSKSHNNRVNSDWNVGNN